MQVAEIIQSVPLFSNVAEEDLSELVASLQRVTHKKGSVIVSHEEPGTNLFILVDGKVKVVLYGASGREVILSLMKDGDFFGEMSLLDGEPRSANVVAMSDTELLVLERHDFIKWLTSHPAAVLGLLGELSKRLREADERIGSLALLDVYGRVARTFLDLGRKEGKRVADGILITERPTQAEIAGLVGTSRETVSRAMSELSRRGYIRQQGRGVLLLGGLDLEDEVMG